MKVLLIGGTGNISTEIVRSLLGRNHEVTIVTRGQRPAPEGVKAVTVDRKDRLAFEAAMAKETPDVVIDMIAYHPDDTASALRAFAGRVRQFIHCSTVMTFGPPIERLFADESCALQAQSDYGKNKILIDQILEQHHRDDGLPMTIVKPSYTYGPGIPLHRQIGDDGRWIDRLRKGKPMLSAGDGNSLFQFLPSRDAGEFFALLVGRQAALGQTYIMPYPEASTWDEWHRMAMAAIGREVEIVHAPSELLIAADPKRYGGIPNNFGHNQVFSCAKAMRDMPEWQPNTDRVAWVAANIEWMDRHGHVVNSDDDDLEDRLIAELKAVPGRVQQG